jgi:hypothetical protein
VSGEPEPYGPAEVVDGELVDDDPIEHLRSQMPYRRPDRMRIGGKPLPGRVLVVGQQVYAWLVRNTSPGPRLRTDTPLMRWLEPEMLLGVPVLISDDPAWPADRWAVVEDGLIVSEGYGEPTQTQLPRG